MGGLKRGAETPDLSLPPSSRILVNLKNHYAYDLLKKLYLCIYFIEVQLVYSWLQVYSITIHNFERLYSI